MKVTSTDKMNEAFKEKDEKYREWTTLETGEKKVVMVVMVPLIISNDGVIIKDSVKRWMDFAPDIKVDWVRMAQNVLLYNVVIVGKFSTRKLGLRDMEERTSRRMGRGTPRSP